MNLIELALILAWVAIVAHYFTFGASQPANKKATAILGAAVVVFLGILIF